jgi:hypothetical protein
MHRAFSAIVSIALLAACATMCGAQETGGATNGSSATSATASSSATANNPTAAGNSTTIDGSGYAKNSTANGSTTAMPPGSSAPRADATSSAVQLQSASNQAAWKLFSPASGEFSIKLPGPVQHTIKDLGGSSVDVYTTQVNKIPFMVEGGYNIEDSSHFDDFANGVERGALESVRKQLPAMSFDVVQKDAGGSSWHGRELTFRGNKKPISTMVVAMSNAVPIALVVVAGAPPDNTEVRTVIDSIEIDAQKSMTAHPLKLREGPAFKAGYLFGHVLIWIVVACIVGAIVAGLLRKRNRDS